MQIFIQNIGKKFQYEWIFRNINLDLSANQSYTIIGPNGSGKSTFLQILSGILPPSSGKLSYQINSKNIPAEEIFKYLVWATPAMELVEEFTLIESINFHLQFKKFRSQISPKDFIEIIGLEKAKNKPVKYFSSGMKQRLKLGFAFYSDTPIILLDEPTSNLDKQGIAWYQKEISRNLQGRLLVLCSNQSYEYEFCENLIDISKMK